MCHQSSNWDIFFFVISTSSKWQVNNWVKTPNYSVISRHHFFLHPHIDLWTREKSVYIFCFERVFKNAILGNQPFVMSQRELTPPPARLITPLSASSWLHPSLFWPPPNIWQVQQTFRRSRKLKPGASAAGHKQRAKYAVFWRSPQCFGIIHCA